MRYLRAPSLFHYRLGWLDVMVRLLGPSRQALSSLWTKLPEAAKNFDGWIAAAGLTAKPHGALTRTHVRDLTRMLVSYGLYDETLGALSDVGQVLLATPEPSESPFLWQGARRWVGLWLLTRADGDVALSVLRAWPDEGLVDDAVDRFMVDRLEHLIRKTADETERAELSGQARRVTGTTSGRRFVVLPRLEPLRELGYLGRVPEHPGYVLTEAGERLRTVLRGQFAQAHADDLLVEGLSRCFFAAEGVHDAAPAGFHALVQGIDSTPEPLLVTKDEVPLSPFVAWLQWSLRDRGLYEWVDDALAASLVRGVRTDPRGSFELKRAEHVGALNLAWRPRAFVAKGDVAVNLGVDPSLDEPVRTLDPEKTEEPEPLNFVTAHGAEIPALLWLQYVASRIREINAVDPDVLRRGGATTRLRQLEALLRLPAPHLENKRKAVPDRLPLKSLPATSCLDRYVAATRTRGHLARLPIEWGACDRVDTDALHARIRAAGEELERARTRSRSEIEAFLRTHVSTPIVAADVVAVFERRWPGVQELTRGLIADLVANGGWAIDALRERLSWFASHEASPCDAATRLLDVLASRLRRYEYWQSRVAAPDWIAAARAIGQFIPGQDEGGVSLEALDNEGRFRLRVTGIDASSREHALDIGRQRCDDAIAQASWRAQRRDSPKRPDEGGESASPEEGDEVHEVASNEPLYLDWGALVERSSPGRALRAKVVEVEDARSSLARLVVLERRAGEHLLTAWTIVEDLAKAGRDIPGYDVIATLARAVAVALLRRRLISTHDQAVGALLALAHVDPQHAGLSDRVEFWTPTWREAYDRVRDQTPVMRRSTLLARAEQYRPGDEVRTVMSLWRGARRRSSDGHKCECEALQRAITSLAPFAARRLADVWSVLDVASDGTLHDPKGLTGVFRCLLEDARAFFSEVYDARNRIVHQGELGRLHGHDAPVHLDVLVRPLLSLVEIVVDELDLVPQTSLRAAWAGISLRATDLADTDRLKDITAEEFIELIGARSV